MQWVGRPRVYREPFDGAGSHRRRFTTNVFKQGKLATGSQCGRELARGVTPEILDATIEDCNVHNLCKSKATLQKCGSYIGNGDR